MSTLTIRIPDDTHGRLKEIARQRGMSVNEFVEELSTVAIAPYDAETRLRVMAARGPVEEGLRVLDKLDAAFARSTDSERGHRLADAIDQRPVPWCRSRHTPTQSQLPLTPPLVFYQGAERCPHGRTAKLAGSSTIGCARLTQMRAPLTPGIVEVENQSAFD